MQTNHAVLHCDPMDKRFLVIYKVSIRHPELISHSVIQSKIERNPCVGQALIAPRLLEIHGDGIVLKNTQKNCSFHQFQRIGHFTLMPDFHCVRYNIEKQVAFTAKKDTQAHISNNTYLDSNDKRLNLQFKMKIKSIQTLSGCQVHHCL